MNTTLNVHHFLTAYFWCQRTNFYHPDTFWLNQGKFDKITFSISSDHYIIGVIEGATFTPGISVIVTINLTDTGKPYRLTAGQDYIAATMVYVPPSTYPPLLKYVNAVNLTQCGPGNITVMFSSASKEEMDDSNGSTVDEGRVPALILKPL